MVDVFPRSPAAEGGIKAGEDIVSANGETLAGLSSAEATDKIKGPEGSRVTVGVRNPKDEEDA